MRFLVISDVHSNLEALEAVLKDAEGLYEAVLCLGDIVGYGPDPNECVERVKGLPSLSCVAGNHDWAAIGKLGVEEFNTDARIATLWTQSVLTPTSVTYLNSLPERIILEDKLTIVHGSPRYPIWEYILTSTVALENFQHFITPWCLVGHSHIPVIFALREANQRACETIVLEENKPFSLDPEFRFIINPGSVGQPRDGDPRASYALLDLNSGVVELRRVYYPVNKTQDKMEKVGLPPRLIARLTFGW
ncbi:MAG: metallophosphoesterase family protein [Anaerolineae bacterium]|nr:metallophosphatase family protein [Anaerolineae bacterium]MDW8103165.1 metallophosphoesterase family protein [Anaerolineae bacterium]